MPPPLLPLGRPAFTGQWSIHNSVAGNESDQVCTFVQTDNKLSGTCKTADNEVPVSGTLDGNKATWKYDMDYNGTGLTLYLSTATLDDSGKIAVAALEVQPFGVTGEFTATPAKESSR